MRNPATDSVDSPGLSSSRYCDGRRTQLANGNPTAGFLPSALPRYILGECTVDDFHG
jgi:hypothetical protein